MRLNQYTNDPIADPEDVLFGTDTATGINHNFTVSSILAGVTFPENVPIDADNIILPVTFKNQTGTWVGTPSVPITGTIVLDNTDGVDGYVAAVYFIGTEVLFSGGTVIMQSGTLIENELCIIWIIYNKANDSYIVNIQNGVTNTAPPSIVETVPVITVT